jgi:hypothetical protein
MDFAIDTNFLRKQALAQALSCAGSSDRFIIPDTTVLETMKNDRWESTARDSFKIIAGYRERIFSATEASKLMNEELESGVDTTSVIDAGLTKSFRALLGEIASEKDGPAMKHLRGVMLSTQADMAAQQQNHPENLNSLKGARDAAKMLVKLKAYRRLLNEDQKREFRLRLAKTLAQRSIKLTAAAEGKNPAIGDFLAAGRGIILRDAIGYNLLGFHWAVLGSLNGLPDDQATNELMDVRQAVIGTYCDALLTEDKGVIKSMRQDILDALDVDPLPFPDEQTTSDSESPASPIPTL